MSLKRKSRSLGQLAGLGTPTFNASKMLKPLRHVGVDVLKSNSVDHGSPGSHPDEFHHGSNYAQQDQGNKRIISKTTPKVSSNNMELQTQFTFGTVFWLATFATQPTQIGCFLPHVSLFYYWILRLQKWLNLWCPLSVYIINKPKIPDNRPLKWRTFCITSWDLTRWDKNKNLFLRFVLRFGEMHLQTSLFFLSCFFSSCFPPHISV